MMPARLPRKVRLAAMVCDHALMCCLFIPPLMQSGWVSEPWDFWLWMACYLNKDFIKGRSPGKRLFRLQVVATDGQPANELRCLVRNLTVLLWPVEVLVLLLGRRTRFGDTLAGTYVSRAPRVASSWWQDVRTYRFTPYLLYTLVAAVVFVLLGQALSAYFLGL